MGLIRQIGKSLLTACVSRDRLIVRGPRTASNRPALALTFDDGPHPEQTPRLLNRLDQLGLHATFFVIGVKAEQHPELIKRMTGAGHEIANHTYTHSEPSRTSAKTFLEEIEKTDRILKEITGQTTISVRPPKGEINWSKLSGLWRAQKTVALWNVDPKDFRMTSPLQMTRWCETYQPQDGDIVLLHDIRPYALQAVESLAEQGVFEQFEAITLSQWRSQSNRHPNQCPPISAAMN